MVFFYNPFFRVFGCIFLSFLTTCEGHLLMKDGFVGIGIDLAKLGLFGSKCPEVVNGTCLCGREGTTVPVSIKICSAAQRWKIKCKPCNDEKPEEICFKYGACLQCHSDGGSSCASCPEGRFGTWCENACSCVNGATCERDGKCTCFDGYTGRTCEKKQGCSPPPPEKPPLQVQLTPPGFPVTAVYSCPTDYELRGQAVRTCLPNKKWSGNSPKCLLKCPLLSAPANGRLKFSANELVEGVTAEVSCNQNHRLIGQMILACMSNGQWNSDLPTCEALASCPDPGNVKYGERALLPGASKLNGHFIQDSKLEYMCIAGYQRLGSSVIICTSDGSWSDDLPECIKVSTIIPDCQTKGSDVVGEVGLSVRILCPPECAEENFNIWGTSIYRVGSSVCRAAIHSAKITNSGGSIAVINNGNYSHFTGSNSNNIESKSFPGIDESFRFDKQPIKSRDAKDCGKGLVRLDKTCVYISNIYWTQKEANAICSNLGLQMEVPDDVEDRWKLVTILAGQGLTSVWASMNDPVNIEDKNLTENVTDGGHQFGWCPVATIHDKELKMESVNCNDVLSFVCVKKSNHRNLAICNDPGPLINGVATPVGTIDDVYYVGSSIEYSCHSLHYIRGPSTISCTASGNWTATKPVCIKVDACEEPPVPTNAFVTYLPPLKSASAQRSAVFTSRLAATRAARMPGALAAPVPGNTIQTTTPEPEVVSLPPGIHRLGVRAMYDCESRYYNLIGSRTRRCQEQGQWSGRPPTCIPICGRSDSPRSPFIVNGNATDIGQWPWQAGVARYVQDNNQWFLLCGASLLNENWVISAAHCVTFAGTTLTIEPEKFQVYLGKYHRKDSKDDEYVQVRKVQEIHIHPDYDPGLFDADIALLRLASPVQLNTRVQPICLPTEQTTRDNLVEGKRGVVTGWGMTENETYAETLQQATLPIVSQENCEKGYADSDMPLTVTDNMFCAGYAQGRTDACSGDSGGPMVFTDSSKERKWVLEGIVSWGSPSGCGNQNQYGGFTTVSKFLDWIHLYF